MTTALYSDDALYACLRELEVIPQQQLDPLYEQSKRSHVGLGDLLVDSELIREPDLGRIVADLIGYPYIALSVVVIPEDLLRLFPETYCKNRQLLPFKRDERGLHVAMSNPKDAQAIDFIEKTVQMPIIIYFSHPTEIRRALSGHHQDITASFDALLHSQEKEPPIIQMVYLILTKAYENKSSDIHIEPQKTESLVRFRIDGILHDAVRLPSTLHDEIVTRIKVLAQMRTDEHQAPQDGKLQFLADGEDVDVRVSIVPLTTGEKIVMRLLAAKSRRISLTDLGFLGTDLEKVRAAYRKPYGMILSTGPTGSGKTTTMYAILKLLNRREVNIMTIEDPVEYRLEGISQIQVNPRTNLTFAEGLRTIVRQDPNIILVGEIRDQETADIAVNAAMTGHLVLSTLHTNDAPTAVPRLLDMGVEPFLIASSVNVIIAQRLVRSIHPGCRVSEEVDLARRAPMLGTALLFRIFDGKTTVRLYKGKGCSLCQGTGYEGRIGIFEVMSVDEEIRQAIVHRQTASEICDIAVKNGMRNMIIDGLEKVKQGMTTIEEVIRVTKE